MTRKLGRWSRRRPFLAVALAVCLLVVAWFATFNGAEILGWQAFVAGVNDLNNVHEAERSCVSWTFPFRDRHVTVTARLGADELVRTEDLTTQEVFRSGGWLRARYVADTVRAQSESPFITLLADDLRRAGDEMDLDDDGRLELMIAAVQAIPYGRVQREIRLPIEVVAYRSGVCTEKSLLLASLMVHEGWESCVWVFDSQRHVGVGVAADSVGFHRSGYAFIETTGPSYVGQAGKTYRSRGPVAEPPQMIRVGGEKHYGSGDEAAYILGVLDLAERGTTRLASYHGFARVASGELGGRFQEIADVQEQASVLAMYIVDNAHDRPGVYAYLRRQRSVDDLNEALTWNGMPQH